MKLYIYLFLIFILFACEHKASKKIKGTILKNQSTLTQASRQKAPEKAYEVEVVQNNQQYADYDKGRKERLTYDLRKPIGKAGKLPLLILVHPGGFLVGSKNDDFITELATDFTKTGYATACVNYRLIGLPDEMSEVGLVVKNPKLYGVQEMYNSIRDVRSAIKYFKSNAEGLAIDTSRVYLLGYSAGAIIALNLAFVEEQEAKEYFKVGEADCLDCLPCLSASTAVNADVKGVIAISGGLFDLEHTNGKKVHPPILLFHGDKDEVVPCAQGKPFESYIKDIDIALPGKKQDFMVTLKNEKYGLTIGNERIFIPKWISSKLRDIISPKLYGSAAIYKRVSKNIQFYSIPRGSHCFMQDAKTKAFAQSYKDMYLRIHAFINEIEQ